MKGGGWRVEDGWWKDSGGGIRVECGVWGVECGGWRVESDGWRVEGTSPAMRSVQDLRRSCFALMMASDGEVVLQPCDCISAS